MRSFDHPLCILYCFSLYSYLLIGKWFIFLYNVFSTTDLKVSYFSCLKEGQQQQLEYGDNILINHILSQHCWTWWLIAVISALKRMRQEDQHEF